MSETYDKHHQSNLDCLEKAETGEPMFIILGRDPDGANLVSLWAERRAAAGDEEHAARVFPIAAAMADWPLMAASAPARTDYPPFRLREHPGRPDEMAAGVIHEPGTGGGDPQDALKRTMLDDVAAESTKMTGELQTTAQQRDFLSRQVDSLVQRLAASHVAQGLIDMAAAQGFVQKEILPINQVLAQIAAQPQPEQST